MPTEKKSTYYLVRGDMLPEVFLKVLRAKELLEAGEAATVAEAAAAAGISRTAFYKYKDAISPFQDRTHGQILTFYVLLRHKMGVLSSVLAIFANTGANILTINQSIPVNGTAAVTISAETAGMALSTDALLARIGEIDGVIRIEMMAG